MLLSAITHCSIFASLTAEEKSMLARYCTMRSFNKGEVIFNHGDVVTYFSIIACGLVQYNLSGGDRYDLLHGVSKSFEFGASMEVYLNIPMLCTCVALRDTKLVVLPKQNFMELLDKYVGIGKALAEIHMRERMMMMKTQTLMLSQTPKLKIGYTLLYLCQKATDNSQKDHFSNGNTVDIAQGELASMIGLSRQTVALTIKSWKSRGMLLVGRGTITILNIQEFKDSLLSG